MENVTQLVARKVNVNVIVIVMIAIAFVQPITERNVIVIALIAFANVYYIFFVVYAFLYVEIVGGIDSFF